MCFYNNIFQPLRRFTYVTAHYPTLPLLHLRYSSFFNPSFASPMSQALHLIHLVSCPWAELILQPFHHFTYVTTHSPTLLSLYLHHSSFSNPSTASPISQFILQPFFCFTYITVHSPTLPLLHLYHSSFSSPSITSPISQLILQSFRHFTYVIASFGFFWF